MKHSLAVTPWIKLILGAVVTGLLALSVHVFMLSGLNIPYPVSYPATGFPGFLGAVPAVFALIFLFRASALSTRVHSKIVQVACTFVIYAMLREWLFRLPIMDGVCSTAWLYSIIEVMPRLAGLLVTTIMIVSISPRLNKGWQLPAAVVIAALLSFVFEPVISWAAKPVLAHFAYLSHEDVYLPPYGWHVQIPAYLTFVEPVAACLIIYANVEQRLSQRPGVRCLQFIALIMMVRRVLLSPFIYIFYSHFTPLMSIASMGQFSLEALTLAGLTVATWSLSGVRSTAGSAIGSRLIAS